MSESRSRAATLLLPRYLEHRERDIATLRRAVDREDFAEVARIGHNLRGNGRSYGFPEIGVLGAELEAAARAKSAPRVLAHLDALQAWLSQNRAPSEPSAPPRPESTTRVRTADDSREGRDDDGD